MTDVELADRLEIAPSRRTMTRPRPRPDYLDGLSTFYETVRRLAQHRGVRFLTSWDELSALCGYQLRVMQRYSDALTEAGVIRVGGVRLGQRWALTVELRQLSSGPAGPCSSTGIPARFSFFSRRLNRRLFHARKCVDGGGS